MYLQKIKHLIDHKLYGYDFTLIIHLHQTNLHKM